MHELFPHPSYSLHREVLLSLRFILGQTRKSRKLAFRRALSTLRAEERDGAFGVLLHGKMDRLLSTPSSLSPDMMSNTPIGEDFLTPWTDCPLLAERLLELQKYSSMQKPTKTSKMIRDKRDLIRWYTLWVVLLLGGMGVVLSALQLAVSCAQLAYAVH